jgi:hypothetical protein
MVSWKGSQALAEFARNPVFPDAERSAFVQPARIQTLPSCC